MIETLYAKYYSKEGKLTTINLAATGESLPFNFESKIFNESNPLVIQLRQNEAQYGQLSLSDRAPYTDLLAKKVGEILKFPNEVNSFENYYWNGNYWLSDKRQTQFNIPEITKNINIILPIDRTKNILVQKLYIIFNIANWTTTKYWDIGLYRVYETNTTAYLGKIETKYNYTGEANLAVNLHDNITTNKTLYYQLQLAKVGGVGNMAIAGHLEYSLAR